MKRLGRDAGELTALADHLTGHGLVLEMLAGPLAGIYDPSGPGRMLFAFFAAMAETEREAIRESTLEGLDAAARMALQRWPALLGLQRSLRRIFQLFSWAFARSPGPRSLAWERLACFWDSGLFLPLYGVRTGPSAP
jgi:hypothetical protein